VDYKKVFREDKHVKKWSIRDIIDFEYFFYRDGVSLSSESQQDLHERDRNIYLNSIKVHVKEGGKPDRRFILRSWLERRRKNEAAATNVLPGESFESLYGSCRILFVLAGIVFGGGAGLTFLTYSGEQPLNVFVYLSVFIFSQLLLLLLLFLLSVYRLKKRSFLSFSPLYRAIGRFLLGLLLWVRGRISEKIGAEHRSRTESALGLIMSKGRTYGIIFILPVFILTQLFAIGFNLGVLATTLFKVITSDIAFGWQSTLELSSAAVHGLVKTIALPWSWLTGPGAGYPSLDQIEGSRIILKEGIYHLSTPDLTSWWPFLCLSILFYGLLPRLLLFLAGAAVQQRMLAALGLKQGNYEQLLLRLTTPLLATRGRSPENVTGCSQEQETGDIERDMTGAAPVNFDRKLLVLVPGDIYDASAKEKIETMLRNRFGDVLKEIVRIDEEYETDAAILANLKKSLESAETDILLIQEAWQPPITEYINFIKNLRITIGYGPCIRIGLIGKPLPDNIFTPVLVKNREIWTRKMNSIGDPCLYVLGMVQNVS
jgi:hypothetical protein